MDGPARNGLPGPQERIQHRTRPTGTTPKRTVLLQTDASDFGLGAVLSQKDVEGLDRPVAYYSKKLNRAERNYSTTERECLAVVKGIEHFYVYLAGVPFTVVTDQASLQHLHSMRNWGGCLTRWALRLQPFSFKVQHRAGTLNQNIDGLSRQAWCNETDEDESDLDPGAKDQTPRGKGEGNVMTQDPGRGSRQD